jgi:hypothetical protein
MIITGDLPRKYLTKPEAMLALYEQGLEFKPIHRTYIFEKMDGVSTYTKRLLVHMYQTGYLIEMPPFDFMDRVPKQFAPKLGNLR